MGKLSRRGLMLGAAAVGSGKALPVAAAEASLARTAIEAYIKTVLFNDSASRVEIAALFDSVSYDVSDVLAYHRDVWKVLFPVEYSLTLPSSPFIVADGTSASFYDETDVLDSDHLGTVPITAFIDTNAEGKITWLRLLYQWKPNDRDATPRG